MANGMLLDKAAVKKFIKQKRVASRPHCPFEQVSDITIGQINSWLRIKLTRAAEMHRPIKTFKDFVP